MSKVPLPQIFSLPTNFTRSGHKLFYSHKRERGITQTIHSPSSNRTSIKKIYKNLYTVFLQPHFFSSTSAYQGKMNVEMTNAIS